MLKDGKIWIGTGKNGPVFLLPSMANRHGLIAGATGTGKTVSLKVLAEGFSEMGVPVFLSDIKSDLSGMVKPGDRTQAIEKRLLKCDVNPEEFEFHDYPSAFWDVYGKNGRLIQATAEAMGPQLLGRMLNLNETQTGVLSILFRYCAQYGYPLKTLEDLKEKLVFMGENAKQFTLHYGNVSPASIGAIQRAVAMLEDEGGRVFFGEEEFDVREWLKLDENDRGMINILSADELFAHPLMYSTFLLWMLTRLYEALPERGDQEKPVAVFFFDEAHLLFDDCSKILMDKIEQVVRLIRSKGVGVYFITQSPADIPMAVLGQLGNRVQHALRAYTPLDQRAVKVAAQTFRANPDFSTEEAITSLKTGEALVSCLDEDGAPGVVQQVTVLPPQSHLGALTEAERARAVQGLPLEEAPEESPDAAPMITPDIPIPEKPETDSFSGIPTLEIPVSSTTPEPVQEITGEMNMSQTFKVFDPVTGQYVEQEKPDMTPAEPAQPVPTIQVAPQAQAVPQVQAIPQIQVPQAAAPIVQQMPVMIQDPTTGQYVQQMMWMQQDPATGSWMPMQMQQPAPAAPAAPTVDPIALAEQQKAAEAARKEAERAALQAQRDAEKAAREAAKAAKEEEAAERRARNDALREEAAERARRNDSVAGRIKNTAISTATRQVTSSLTRGITKAISDLFGGKKK